MTNLEWGGSGVSLLIFDNVNAAVLAWAICPLDYIINMGILSETWSSFEMDKSNF